MVTFADVDKELFGGVLPSGARVKKKTSKETAKKKLLKC